MTRPHAQRAGTDRGWRGEGLLFVGGHPRSGTTFLGRLLGAHPGIAYAEEPGLLEVGDRLASVIRPTLERLHADAAVALETSRRNVALREQFGSLAAARLEARVDAQVRHALHGLCRDLQDRSGARYVLDKTPQQVLRFEATAARFTGAIFVDIVRDPRDIVCSMLEWSRRWGRPGWLREGPDDVSATAAQWVEYIEAGRRTLRAAPTRTVRLRYRSLLADPRGTVMPLLDRLGLPWHSGLDRFLDAGMGGLDATRVGRWRRELPAEARRRVEAIAGVQMAELGYDPAAVE